MISQVVFPAKIALLATLKTVRSALLSTVGFLAIMLTASICLDFKVSVVCAKVNVAEKNPRRDNDNLM